MKRMKGRLLTALVSIAMVFTMMPMMSHTVYADDPAPEQPAMVIGPDALSAGWNTSDAQRVYCGKNDNEEPIAWHVIRYGVATDKDPKEADKTNTMTLFSVKELKPEIQFNVNYKAQNADHYEASTLKEEIDKLTGKNGIFSGAEESGVVKRDLAAGGYVDDPPYTDGIAGNEVTDALLWPLSTMEAYYTHQSLLRVEQEAWENKTCWLRSPGNNFYGETPMAAYVVSTGAVDHVGHSVGSQHDLRPAFNFNLKSVIFTSAAAGGKSDTVGLLSEVGTNDSSEWKLTLKDEAHESFSVNDMMQTAGTKKFTIQYGEAAADGETEYISAVIKSKDNRIKYYGKITEAVAGDKNECEIDIGEIAMEGGDTLCVFNEQCNGTNKTDYASELTEVYTEPIPPTITTQPNDLKLTYGDTTGDTLEVAAEAEEGCTLSYQWYRKDSETAEPVLLKNETGATYTVPTDQNVDTTKYYYCEVTATRTADGARATTTSDTAAVTVNKAKLTITAEDKSSKVGEALKPLTYTVSGDYVEGDDLGITVTTDANKDKAGNYDIKVDWNNNKNYDATLVNGKYTVTAAPTPVPPAPKTSGTPTAKMSAGKTSITMAWSKIQGVDGYDIFFAQCNHNKKKIVCKNVKNIKGNKTFKWTKSGLKKGTAYKSYVKAYVMKNGKKTYVKTSPMMHAYTGNGTKKYTNAKSVTVKKAKVSLKKGKTYKIKASVKKMKKNKKLMPKSHVATLRYLTSNSKVATVSKSGKITAKGKGSCVIYVFAHNGVSKQIKVTVN